MKTIYCLFSIANDYNQPVNNLEVWWKSKPSFETVLTAIGGSFTKDDTLMATAKLLMGESATLNHVEYRIETVEEGILL